MKPSRVEDLEGKQFGRLLVMTFSHTATNGSAYWNCSCSCGKSTTTKAARLKTGATVSCGCYAREATTARNLKHGYSGKSATPEQKRTYNIWFGIIERCVNVDNPAYKDYGARGITVTPKWLEFLNFVEDMGLCEEGYSIERQDNNGNYEPENCIWLLRGLQAKNRRSTISVNFMGKDLCLKDACKLVNLPYHTIRYHIVKGKDFTEVVNHFKGVLDA